MEKIRPIKLMSETIHVRDLKRIPATEADLDILRHRINGIIDVINSMGNVITVLSTTVSELHNLVRIDDDLDDLVGEPDDDEAEFNRIFRDD